MEKRMARFIQGDRPEASAELVMTGWKLARLFLGVALACEKPAGDRFAAGGAAGARDFPETTASIFLRRLSFGKTRVVVACFLASPEPCGGRGLPSKQAGQEF